MNFPEKYGPHLFWAKLLAGTMVFQAVIQALGFLTGLLIVRFLSKEDYAWYTIVGTMGPVLAMMADSGITTGSLAIGGRIWQDDEKMGRLVRTGLRLRYRFAWFSGIVMTPTLGWMLLHNNASIGLTVCLVAITLVGIVPQLSAAILNVVVELRQQLPQIRDFLLKSVGLRLFIILVVIAASMANSFWAVFAGSCAAILQTFLLTRFVRKQLSWDVPADKEYEKEILTVVRKVAPLTVYFCFQSQIAIWLISIFGGSHQVADLGALTRLGILFTVFTSTAGMVVVPRFARIQDYHLLKVRFFQIVGGYALLMVLLTGAAALLSGPLVALLGPKYVHLQGVVWLVMLSGALGSLANLLGNLNNCRGWVPPALLSIPLEIATQIVLLFSLDLSQVRDVLLFSCLGIIPVIFLTIGVAFSNMKKFRHGAAVRGN